jgi:hypothetical protein
MHDVGAKRLVGLLIFLSGGRAGQLRAAGALAVSETVGILPAGKAHIVMVPAA